MDKVLGYLGLAKRANQVCCGEVLIEAIRHKKCHVVLIAADASERSKKQISDKCTYYGIPYFITSNSETLSRSIGKANIKSVGVNDGNLSKAIIDAMNRNEVD